MTRKNLVIVHLESIAWQALNAFPEAFPNLRRVMPSARVYRWYFSSATSTQMVLAFLFHANDFEFDAAAGIARPAANNPSLFATLRAAGYRSEFLCVSALQAKEMLPLIAGSFAPIWTTNDFEELLSRFEGITVSRPFAIYVWNLATHVEHALALAPYADGVDELVGGACAVADHALGALLEILERRNLIEETTIVIYGDHGDDYWTHGFKKGILHGLEPYTHLVHAPLVIRDASLAPGNEHRLASTVDLAPTMLDLLGLPCEPDFPESGMSLLRGPARPVAFAQNFAANQPDNAAWDIRKAFSANDRSYTLLASSRGLELFNHRLDLTNHCNLLHFFDLDAGGAPVLRPPEGFAHPHFAAAMRHVLGNENTVSGAFARLHSALKHRIARKHAYVAARNPPHLETLDSACLDMISRHGRERFFGKEDAGAPAPAAPPVPEPTMAVPPMAVSPPPATATPARSWFGGLVDAVRRKSGDVRH